MNRRSGKAARKQTDAIRVIFVLLCLASIASAVDGPARVGMALDGRLLINDQPYFFIGTAPGPPIDLRTPEGGYGWSELAEGGITVVRGAMPGKAWTPENTERVQASTWTRPTSTASTCGRSSARLVELQQSPVVPRSSPISSERTGTIRSHVWKSADEPEWGEAAGRAAAEAYEADPRARSRPSGLVRPRPAEAR